MTEAVHTKITTLPPHAGPRAVAAERAREAFFSSLSRELRWSLDHEERFGTLDGAWQSVLGWRPERLHGWHWEEIVHPADRIRVAKAFERLRAGGGAERDLEIRLAQATGGYRLMQWTFVAGAGADSFLGLGHDRAADQASADLARTHAELNARIAQLEERYAAVERFAAVAAHQLSEPLIVAESSAIMLAEELEDTLDATLRDRLDAIGRSSARARRLVDALLAEARSADQLPTLREVDVAEVLHGVLTTLGPRMLDRRVTTVTSDLPTVCTEPQLLGIVFENLLSNAIKYGPRSGGEIRVEAEPLDGAWRIGIRSGGAPIAAADAERIFEPFRRAPGERRAAGTGLGLTICARLVERLGGTIELTPGEAEGNTFSVVLPDAG